MSERVTDARLRELAAAQPDRMGGTLIDTLLLRELAAEILAARTPDDAAERATRGQAWALAEAQGEVAVLRAQVAAAEGERDAAVALHRLAPTEREILNHCIDDARASLADVADALGMPADWDAEWGDRVRDALAAAEARWGEPTWSGCHASEWRGPGGGRVALRSEPGAVLLTTFPSPGAQGDERMLARNGEALTPLPDALDAADRWLRERAPTKGP